MKIYCTKQKCELTSTLPKKFLWINLKKHIQIVVSLGNSTFLDIEGHSNIASQQKMLLGSLLSLYEDR